MVTEAERRFFHEHGYLHAPGVLDSEHLARLRAAFDAASAAGGRKRVWQEALLGIPEFLELLQHPPLIDRLRAVFGDQLQLLSYDLLYQGPNSQSPERAWHRDFVFPGDRPLAVNSIVYLDDMTDERGPTFVVPGTHRGTAVPPKARIGEPLHGEVAVCARAGDVAFINAAIWHSGARNRTAGERRTLYAYFGYWWLKRDNQHAEIPPQALERASLERRRLLGVEPAVVGDMWIYDPDAGKVRRQQ